MEDHQLIMKAVNNKKALLTQCLLNGGLLKSLLKTSMIRLLSRDSVAELTLVDTKDP